MKRRWTSIPQQAAAHPATEAIQGLLDGMRFREDALYIIAQNENRLLLD